MINLPTFPSAGAGAPGNSALSLVSKERSFLMANLFLPGVISIAAGPNLGKTTLSEAIAYGKSEAFGVLSNPTNAEDSFASPTDLPNPLALHCFALCTDTGFSTYLSQLFSALCKDKPASDPIVLACNNAVSALLECHRSVTSIAMDPHSFDSNKSNPLVSSFFKQEGFAGFRRAVSQRSSEIVEICERNNVAPPVPSELDGVNIFNEIDDSRFFGSNLVDEVLHYVARCFRAFLILARAEHGAKRASSLNLGALLSMFKGEFDEPALSAKMRNLIDASTYRSLWGKWDPSVDLSGLFASINALSPVAALDGRQLTRLLAERWCYVKDEEKASLNAALYVLIVALRMTVGSSTSVLSETAASTPGLNVAFMDANGDIVSFKDTRLNRASFGSGDHLDVTLGLAAFSSVRLSTLSDVHTRHVRRDTTLTGGLSSAVPAAIQEYNDICAQNAGHIVAELRDDYSKEYVESTADAAIALRRLAASSRVSMISGSLGEWRVRVRRYENARFSSGDPLQVKIFMGGSFDYYIKKASDFPCSVQQGGVEAKNAVFSEPAVPGVQLMTSSWANSVKSIYELFFPKA